MRKPVAVILLSLFLALTLSADVHKGKKYYMKELKSKLKMNGLEFVKLHTRAQWEALFADNAEGFIETFSARYPRQAKYFHSKRFLRKMPDLRDFAVEYAKDSGKVPTCGEDAAPAAEPLLNPAGESSVTPF